MLARFWSFSRSFTRSSVTFRAVARSFRLISRSSACGPSVLTVVRRSEKLVYSTDFSVAPRLARAAALVPGLTWRKLSPRGLVLVMIAMLSVFTGTLG